MRAKQLGGEMKYLSYGEIDARNRRYSRCSTETWRAWEYWANKAGVGHLLTRFKKMTGSLVTPRWRGMDSNFQFRVTRPRSQTASFRL
jgi:hypothetical protein